jgi:hypothetical protein
LALAGREAQRSKVLRGIFGLGEEGTGKRRKLHNEKV